MKNQARIERKNSAKQLNTQYAMYLTREAKQRRRELLAFVEQHASQEQLLRLDEQMDGWLAMSRA